MRRGESMFEIDLNAHEEVERGFETEGSNLSGVSARCSWVEQDFKDQPKVKTVDSYNSDGPTITAEETLQIRTALQRGLRNNGRESRYREEYKEDLRESRGVFESTELLNIRRLEGLHLTFNLEAGSLLPLAIR